MKSVKMQRRELYDLLTVVIVSIVFSIFSLSTHFFYKLFDYFYPYIRFDIVEYIFSVIFFWLLSLIWVTYRSWRKAEQSIEKLKTLAFRDELTKLFNRRGFFTLAEHQLKMAKREKKEITMLYMDINGLKLINDIFGHNVGDQLLIDTADVMNKTFREADILARIGGDEFVALLFGSATDSATIPARRFKEHIKDFNAQYQRSYKLDVSTGIISFDFKNPISIEELLEQADRAMYKEKREKAEKAPEMQCATENPLLITDY